MAWGGVRPGAGRKRSPESLERERVEKLLQRRRCRVADRLFNAQLAVAEGASFVYEVVETGQGKDKKREHILVTDPERIKMFLDGERDGSFMYITTEKPDAKVIADIFDRAFGKPPQAIEMTTRNGDAETRELDDGDIDGELDQLDQGIAEATQREASRPALGEAKAESVH